MIGTKAIQLCTPEEKRYSPNMTQIYVDIGATDREDALRYVQIGDPVTLEGECLEFGDRRFMAKAIDDRLLCAVMIHLLREPRGDLGSGFSQRQPSFELDQAEKRRSHIARRSRDFLQREDVTHDDKGGR